MIYMLCTLSGQHIPNLLSVHKYNPDILFLLETKIMQSKREPFLDALKLGGYDYSKPKHKVISIDDEDNVDDLKSKLEEIYQKYNEGVWIINLNGGTKWIGVIQFDYFQNKGAQFIYTSHKDSNQFLQWGHKDPVYSAYRISIKEFLKGYGFSLQKSKPFKTSDGILNLAIQIARTMPDADFLRLDRDQWEITRKKGRELKSGEFHVESSEIRELIKDVFHLNQDENDNLVGQLSPEGGDFFTGGWLEIFMAGLLHRHAEALAIWDLQLNIVIDKVTNELDVSFMHQNRFYIIECKSGDQSHDPKASILYKNSAIAKQFNAIGVQSIIATTTQSVMKEEQVDPYLQMRADLYNCRILTKKKIQEFAEHENNYIYLQDALFKR